MKFMLRVTLLLAKRVHYVLIQTAKTNVNLIESLDIVHANATLTLENFTGFQRCF